MDVSQEVKQKVEELQVLEQNLHSLLLQRNTIQASLNEVDSALGEVDSAEVTYKIIGNVMVKSNKDSVKGDLEKKKETSELRLKSLASQENKVKAKIEELQSLLEKEVGQ